MTQIVLSSGALHGAATLCAHAPGLSAFSEEVEQKLLIGSLCF